MKQVGETFSDATRRYVLGVLVVIGPIVEI